MVSKEKIEVNEVFARWRIEDEELGRKVDEIRQWMRELDLIGKQHFGETATYLRDLRKQMVRHFEREVEMLEQIGKLYTSGSPEILAVRRQSDREHHNLLGRAEDMIARLDQIDPPFESWQQAMDEMDGLVSLLEQHESNEWDSIEMLLPQ